MNSLYLREREEQARPLFYRESKLQESDVSVTTNMMMKSSLKSEWKNVGFDGYDG